jgi:hypothetical protein
MSVEANEPREALSLSLSLFSVFQFFSFSVFQFFSFSVFQFFSFSVFQIFSSPAFPPQPLPRGCGILPQSECFVKA